MLFHFYVLAVAPAGLRKLFENLEMLDRKKKGKRIGKRATKMDDTLALTSVYTDCRSCDLVLVFMDFLWWRRLAYTARIMSCQRRALGC